MISINTRSKGLPAGAGILGLLLLIFILPAKSEPIIFTGPACLDDTDHTVHNCIGSIGVPSVSTLNIDFTTAAGGGIVTNIIQGNMAFETFLFPNPRIQIRTQQLIIPGLGPISFNSGADIYIWADQPLINPMTVFGHGCSTFTSFSPFFSMGDCEADLAGPLNIPVLGDNPDLANAAHLHIAAGALFCDPSCGVPPPPGFWINTFDLNFSTIGDPSAAHLRLVIDGNATYNGGTLVPEPVTAVQVGAGGAMLIAIAYWRKRRRLGPIAVRGR